MTKETYDSFLASLGITRDSDEEIALLEQVFDVDFSSENTSCSCSAETHHDHEEEEDMEEISDDELLEAVKAYLEKHPR